MRSRNKRLLLGAIGLLVLVGVVFSLRPSEPSYRGRQLSEWLKDLDSASSDEQKNAAKQAIHEMGAAGVPYLVRDLRCHDSPLKNVLLTLVSKQTVIRVAFTPAVERRKRAHRAFPEVASVATPAVPELADALMDTDSDVRMRAANCLEWVAWKANADKAVSALINALTDPDMRVRQNAAAALKNMRTSAARQAVPALLDRLSSDERFEVRGSAAEALGAIQPASLETVQALVVALRDDAWGVRSASATALGNLGTDAKQAVSELSSLATGDDDDHVRSSARAALRRIAPERQYQPQ